MNGTWISTAILAFSIVCLMTIDAGAQNNPTPLPLVHHERRPADYQCRDTVD